MKRKAKASALILAAVLGSAVLLGGCARQTGAADPVAITVWHYYNGAQQGIVVEPHSYGTIGDLTQQVKDAIYDKVGAEPLPDLFAAYADTAYEIDRLGMLADLGEYLTTEEQQTYIAAYLDEGRFDTGGFKIFPVAKSTELLSVNKTEWDAFSAATGASEADLATWEGIASLAERYYDWTDARTPDLSGDGKAFFGRDAFANYILIGSMQLGVELFSVEDGRITLQVDHDVMRRLWDNYYVPYVKGYYASYGKFRSDDLRTGDIAAYVGSTSGATYFPGEVTRADGSTYAIEGAVYPLPNFAGTQPMAVQQGAGMVVVKSTEEREPGGRDLSQVADRAGAEHRIRACLRLSAGDPRGQRCGNAAPGGTGCGSGDDACAPGYAGDRRRDVRKLRILYQPGLRAGIRGPSGGGKFHVRPGKDGSGGRGRGHGTGRGPGHGAGSVPGGRLL